MVNVDGHSTDNIRGFEDIDDCNREHKKQEVAQETPADLNSSQLEEGKETKSTDGSPQHDSSRTRTAQLSHNGYSKELFKFSQKPKSLERTHSCPAVMKDSHYNLEAEKLGSVNEATPQGIDHTLMMESKGSPASKSANVSSELNAPPGFENYLTKNTRKKGLSRAIKKSHQGVVTRSKKGTQPTSSPAASGTPESLVRLVNESLDVGELLGVRITRNRQSVVRRLTRSLKNQRNRQSAVPEVLNCENEVHRVQMNKQLENDGSVSSSSRSRTKTTQLSGNDYTEEMAKIYNNGLTEEDEEVNKLNSPSEGNSREVALGFNPVIGAKYGEGSCEATLHRKKKVTKQLHTQSAKQMTRSQMKQSKGPDSANQIISEELFST